MKLKSSNIIAFDLGSSKIAAVAASMSKNGDSYVNSQVVRSSKGINKGMVTDLSKAEESFISTIYALENDIDKSVNKISLALSSAEIRSFFVNQTIKLGSSPISKQDIKRLIQRGISDFKIPNLQIIHYFPIDYILDETNIVDNPIGLHAQTLSCQIHIIAANSLMLLNVSKCFAKCQVEITEVISATYAAGEANLTEDEKNLGAIIIDLGSSLTSFAVFFNNKCIYIGNVAIGSAQITSDIAKKFSISLMEAEKIKILYGTADPSLLPKQESILIENTSGIGHYEGDVRISNQMLSLVISNRIKEIFKLIKERYDSLNLDDLISQRVVLTGGGSNLHGIVQASSKILNKKVRLGRPEQLDGFSENYNTSAYSSAIGIIINKSNNLANNQYLNLDENKNWLRKTFSWIKENI